MRKLIPIIVASLLSFGGHTPVFAFAEKAETKKQCRMISRQQAVKKAQKQTGGKVVSVKLKNDGKDSVYRVRVLVGDKRIKNISIKACK
ncbi:MAG: PepSY domain-containing protein [Kangiellaceae bacterium]|nr:PepSY domain-containing protein [Kangiellaceae bacterium]